VDALLWLLIPCAVELLSLVLACRLVKTMWMRQIDEVYLTLRIGF
jgi:hypothetical protein